MPAANLPLVIDKGEDFTCQIIWTNEWDEPQTGIIAPMRMNIVGNGAQIVISLMTSEEEPEEGEIPDIVYAPEIGMIQLHITRARTAALNPGIYQYDLFVTVNDDDEYAGNQQVRLIAGQVIVNQRVTVM